MLIQELRKMYPASISAKVEKDYKKIRTNINECRLKVKAVQYITLKAMNDNAPDMSAYKKTNFYKSTQLLMVM